MARRGRAVGVSYTSTYFTSEQRYALAVLRYSFDEQTIGWLGGCWSGASCYDRMILNLLSFGKSLV